MKIPDASSVARAAEEVVHAAQRAFSTGLQTNFGGNISARVAGADACVIKSTGGGFSEVTADNLCLVTLDGEQIGGNGKPTSDLGIHLALYRFRSDIGGIAHVHSPWATGWASAEREVPLRTVTVREKLGRFPLVPLAQGMASQTAPQILAAIGGGGEPVKAALLARHGPIAFAASVWAAVQILELVEENAHIETVHAILSQATTNVGKS